MKPHDAIRRWQKINHQKEVFHPHKSRSVAVTVSLEMYWELSEKCKKIGEKKSVVLRRLIDEFLENPQ